MTLRELISHWEQRRDGYERVGALVNGAKLIDEFIADLLDSARTEANRVLTLKAASEESGYSVDHLARLVREGQVPNAGRVNAPRIRAQDLPRRPKRFAQSSKASYDVMTDARSLGVRR